MATEKVGVLLEVGARGVGLDQVRTRATRTRDALKDLVDVTEDVNASLDGIGTKKGGGRSSGGSRRRGGGGRGPRRPGSAGGAMAGGMAGMRRTAIKPLRNMASVGIGYALGEGVAGLLSEGITQFRERKEILARMSSLMGPSRLSSIDSQMSKLGTSFAYFQEEVSGAAEAIASVQGNLKGLGGAMMMSRLTGANVNAVASSLGTIQRLTVGGGGPMERAFYTTPRDPGVYDPGKYARRAGGIRNRYQKLIAQAGEGRRAEWARERSREQARDAAAANRGRTAVGLFIEEHILTGGTSRERRLRSSLQSSIVGGDPVQLRAARDRELSRNEARRLRHQERRASYDRGDRAYHKMPALQKQILRGVMSGVSRMGRDGRGMAREQLMASLQFQDLMRQGGYMASGAEAKTFAALPAMMAEVGAPGQYTGQRGFQALSAMHQGLRTSKSGVGSALWMRAALSVGPVDMMIGGVKRTLDPRNPMHLDLIRSQGMRNPAQARKTFEEALRVSGGNKDRARQLVNAMIPGLEPRQIAEMYQGDAYKAFGDKAAEDALVAGGRIDRGALNRIMGRGYGQRSTDVGVEQSFQKIGKMFQELRNDFVRVAAEGANAGTVLGGIGTILEGIGNNPGLRSLISLSVLMGEGAGAAAGTHTFFQGANIWSQVFPGARTSR